MKPSPAMLAAGRKELRHWNVEPAPEADETEMIEDIFRAMWRARWNPVTPQELEEVAAIKVGLCGG